MAIVDRRKLAAPVLAQAASFVVVLVIGGVTGHSSTPKPGPSPSVTAPHASTSSPSGARGQQPEPTINVTVDGGAAFFGMPVRVLRDGTLRQVASGTLSANPNAQDPTQLEGSQKVPPGRYQVCVQPPKGFGFTGGINTGAQHGWFCVLAVAAAGTPTPVTLRLTPGAR